jgi:endonuclease/exonuclease/phosphatase family metal-dependent hydrolase
MPSQFTSSKQKENLKRRISNLRPKKNAVKWRMDCATDGKWKPTVVNNNNNNSDVALSNKKEHIGFVTYNIYFNVKLQLRQRTAAVIHEIRLAKNPAVVVFQEVKRKSWALLEPEVKAMGYNIILQDEQMRDYFTVLLTKFKVVDFNFGKFNNTRMGRGLLMATLEVNADSGGSYKLVVGTAHLESPVTVVRGQQQPFISERQDQMKECLETLTAKVTSSNSAACVFLGDFNWNDDRDGSVATWSGGELWTDCWTTCKGESDPGYTYNAVRNEMLSGKVVERPDRVLLWQNQSNFNVVAAKLLGTEPIKHVTTAKGKPVLASDHYGLCVQLHYSQKRKSASPRMKKTPKRARSHAASSSSKQSTVGGSVRTYNHQFDQTTRDFIEQLPYKKMIDTRGRVSCSGEDLKALYKTGTAGYLSDNIISAYCEPRFNEFNVYNRRTAGQLVYMNPLTLTGLSTLGSLARAAILDTSNVLVMPVNVTLIHWYLVILANSTMYVFDSLRGNTTRPQTYALRQFLYAVRNTNGAASEIRIEHISTPRQGNLYDCGIFVLMFCAAILMHCNGKASSEWDFRNVNMDEVRQSKVLSMRDELAKEMIEYERQRVGGHVSGN